MSKFEKVGLLAVGVLSTGLASAAVDAATQASLDAAKSSIADTGAAVFGVYLAIKLVKWVRRAL